VRIDRALSPADLEALTRLRVRFSIFLEENAAVAASVHSDLETESGDGDGKVKEKTTLQMQIGAEGMEVFSLFEQARAISMNYRGDFDNLRETVLDDLIGFFRLVKTEAQQFIRLHEEEVGRLADGKDVIAELDELENDISELKTSQQGMVQMAYGFAIEPLIMLFNGGDVRAIFGPTGIMKGAVTGITLPEQHVLLQSIPNPVSGVASIPYHLDQPSERTLLRVYASTGELVATQDLGARGSGDHTGTVDMSSRAPGVYLYELTIAAPSGQQVYSRRMQVVR
jgi:hypothetical protein